jgi:hypothetical protein
MGAAGFATEHLGHHFTQGSALGKVVSMRAVRAEDDVLLSQRITNADGDRLLTRGQMRRAQYLAIEYRLHEAFLALPYPLHGPVQLRKPRLGISRHINSF